MSWIRTVQRRDRAGVETKIDINARRAAVPAQRAFEAVCMDGGIQKRLSYPFARALRRIGQIDLRKRRRRAGVAPGFQYFLYFLLAHFEVPLRVLF